MQLNEAEAILTDVTHVLLSAGLIERAWPVGEVARRLPQVAHAEALVVPTIYVGTTQALPGFEGLRINAQVEKYNLYLRTLDKWLAAKVIQKSEIWRADGKVRAFWWLGRSVKLHACLPGMQPGLLRVLLTGPEQFANKFRAPSLRGGYLPDGHQLSDGRYLIAGAPTEVPDEEALFELAGLPFVEARRRR